jgi:hypothetical protein
MRLTKQMTFLTAFLVTAACAYGQDVHYNYDRNANFSAYKTYQWVDIPGGTVPDQLIDNDIKRSADEQLAQRGLIKVEQNADCTSVISCDQPGKERQLMGTATAPAGAAVGHPIGTRSDSTIPSGSVDGPV